MSLGSQLEQLETAQLLRHLIEEEPAYMFRHTLTQESAYDSLLKNQRREIHRAVAQAYEQIYADRCMDELAATLVRHYAEAGDEEQTLVYATQAGDLAARMYANTEAIQFYQQALDLAKQRLGNTAQLTLLYTRLGRAHELAGDYPQALEIYCEMESLAQTRGDGALELAALIFQTTAYAIGSGGAHNPQKAQDLSMRALGLAEKLGDRGAQARIYWNLLLINRFGNEGPAKAVDYGEKSLALARELGLTEQIALSLKDLSSAYTITGKMESALAHLPEAVTLWRQLDNAPMLADALALSSISSFLQGRLDEAIQTGQESYRLNQSVGNRYGLSLTGGLIWYPFRELGQLHRAIELAEESIAIADEMKIYGVPWSSRVELAATYDWLGEPARATEYAKSALATAGPKTLYPPIFPSSVLASIELHQGNLDQAEEWLAPLSADSRDDFFLTYVAGAVQVFSAPIELALAHNDANSAIEITDHAIELFRNRGMVMLFPSLWHFKAKALRMLNRVDEAYALLTKARHQAEAMASRYSLLPILLTIIEMDAETRERDNARIVQLRRDEARTVIQLIAKHTPPGLRASFLNRPDVRKVIALA